MEFYTDIYSHNINQEPSINLEQMYQEDDVYGPVNEDFSEEIDVEEDVISNEEPMNNSEDIKKNPDISISDVTEDDDMAKHIVIDGIDFWIPKVPDELKPRVPAHYPSKDAIEEMYYKYALEVGLNFRRNTERKNGLGIITLKYPVCNRQGVPNTTINIQYRIFGCN
ncbi:hypothetical protein LXL04_016233 [Taraxacum kok-saghyz]